MLWCGGSKRTEAGKHWWMRPPQQRIERQPPNQSPAASPVNDVSLQFAIDAVGNYGSDFVEAFEPSDVVLVRAQLHFGFRQGGDAGVLNGGDDRARVGTSIAGLIDASVCRDTGLLHDFLAGFYCLSIRGRVVGLDDHDAHD